MKRDVTLLQWLAKYVSCIVIYVDVKRLTWNYYVREFVWTKCGVTVCGPKNISSETQEALQPPVLFSMPRSSGNCKGTCYSGIMRPNHSNPQQLTQDDTARCNCNMSHEVPKERLKVCWWASRDPCSTSKFVLFCAPMKFGPQARPNKREVISHLTFTCSFPSQCLNPL